MFEIAIGDSYGSGFEYVPSEIVKRYNDLTHYRKHQKYNIGLGKYTDDTQMSLANAELLVEGVEFTPLNIAQKFVDVFKRDPREGYAAGFYAFLQEIKTGEEFLAKIHPDNEKSGGAMRAMPIGILRDIEKVKEYSRIQAAVTHNTPRGINAALASSLMTHYFVYSLGPRTELGKFIEQQVEGNWNSAWQGKVGALGIESVRAAITAIQQSNSLADILKRCIAFEGDVDTVAAIAMGAASCSREIEKDLPQCLVDGLENQKFGRDYLIAIDQKLMALRSR